MTGVKSHEEIKALFDELRAAKNLAVSHVVSAAKKREHELKKLKDKLRTHENICESVTRDLEETQLELKSKKVTNVDQNQKVAIANSISVLQEANDKLESQMTHLKTEYEHCVEETDKKVSEMKEIWNAHCQAMHRYKKNLNIYIDIDDEDDSIFTVYFFQTDKESGSDYTVKLKRKQDLWEMISMNPNLPQEKKLQNQLLQTNDIQGFMACVWKIFTQHRDKRNEEKKALAVC